MTQNQSHVTFAISKETTSELKNGIFGVTSNFYTDLKIQTRLSARFENDDHVETLAYSKDFHVVSTDQVERDIVISSYVFYISLNPQLSLAFLRYTLLPFQARIRESKKDEAREARKSSQEERSGS